jgi:ribose transport system ATP-binding protein
MTQSIEDQGTLPRAGISRGNSGAAIIIEGLSKRFGATQALDGVGFTVGQGEVRGLIGENGAGKSTLLKILSGLLHPERGTMSVFGRSYRPRTPQDAHAFGVQTAFQELTLADDLTVTQNLLLPYEPRSRLGLVDRRHSRQEAQRIFSSVGIEDIDVDREVRGLSLSDRQRIEIVRSIARKPRILLLDEATSALSRKDVEWLYALVRRLCQEGVVVIFISHRIPEIRHLCNSITILRNGQHVLTQETAELSDAEIVRLVIGRSLLNAFPPKTQAASLGTSDRPRLSVRNLRVGRQVSDASFDLYPGQILGLAALDGMGQAELFAALFGATLTDSGEIRVDGRPVAFSTPLDAVKAGLGYVPSDRRKEGVLINLSGTMNMALSVLERYAPFHVIDTRRLQLDISGFLAKLNIHPRALYRKVGSFSGGNQQKFVIAKWLLAEAPVLLLNDPTRGVDVGTKFEIFSIMRSFAGAGGAVLFYSTELTELANMCDDVLVMYRGRFVDSFSSDRISEENLMHSVLGQGDGGSDLVH